MGGYLALIYSLREWLDIRILNLARTTYEIIFAFLRGSINGSLFIIKYLRIFQDII